MAQRVGRGIALLFHDRGTRGGCVVSPTPRPHFTSGKDPVPILQEAWWAPGPVWTSGKAHPHRDSIPDHPTCSQSLYRLSYRVHHPLLVPWSRNSRAIPLLPLWAVRPVQSLSACTGVHFTFFTFRLIFGASYCRECV